MRRGHGRYLEAQDKFVDLRNAVYRRLRAWLYKSPEGLYKRKNPRRSEGFKFWCPNMKMPGAFLHGLAAYVVVAETKVRAPGVMRFYQEKFFTPTAGIVTSGIKFTRLHSARELFGPVGTTQPDAFESNRVTDRRSMPRGDMWLL